MLHTPSVEEMQPIVARGAASLIAAYALLVVLDVAFRLPALLAVSGAPTQYTHDLLAVMG